MADTIRTVLQLITASADNTTGLYTNANQRDFITSAMSFGQPNPAAYGTLTSGFLGDGVSHPASANGYATLAVVQAAFRTATFTATGSGTNLTISSVTGIVYPGLTLETTTGIGAGITILKQISGTLCGAGVYVTSATTTISAAAAATSIARATSDDMAGLMIMAAVTAQHPIGGPVLLPRGSYILNAMGLKFPPGTNTRVIGLGQAQNVILLCGNASAGAAVSVYGLSSCIGSIENLTLEGLNAGRNFGSASNAGVAYTSMYTGGSTGLYISQCDDVRFIGINIFNFDEAYGYDLVNGNTFSILHQYCCIQGNNHGASIGATAPNSNEAMRWEHCSISNNNVGLWMICQDNVTLGAGNALGADIFVFACQLDYNVVSVADYRAFGAGSLCKSRLLISQCHIETSQNCSGTAAWCQGDGLLQVDDNFNFMSQGTTLGLMAATGFWSAFMGTGNFGPDLFGNRMPLYYSSGGTRGTYLQGNTGELTTNALTATTSSGNLFGTPQVALQNNSLTGAYVLAEDSTDYLDSGFIVGATLNITIPLDSTVNFMIGTKFEFTTISTFTGTFVATGGVTLNSSGAGNTFGGTNTKTVQLKKVAANRWSATGQMT